MTYEVVKVGRGRPGRYSYRPCQNKSWKLLTLLNSERNMSFIDLDSPSTNGKILYSIRRVF
jgi:hypothetical protein